MSERGSQQLTQKVAANLDLEENRPSSCVLIFLQSCGMERQGTQLIILWLLLLFIEAIYSLVLPRQQACFLEND